MFDVYDVEAWWLFTPWVLWGITGIILWRSVVSGKRWMKRHDLERYETFDLLSAANAEVRESSAAHREATRKLETAETEISALRDALKKCQEK